MESALYGIYVLIVVCLSFVALTPSISDMSTTRA